MSSKSPLLLEGDATLENTTMGDILKFAKIIFLVF